MNKQTEIEKELEKDYAIVDNSEQGEK